jgi:hypothetical protein
VWERPQAAASRYKGRVIALQFIALGGTFTRVFPPRPRPRPRSFLSLPLFSLLAVLIGWWQEVLPFLWRCSQVQLGASLRLSPPKLSSQPGALEAIFTQATIGDFPAQPSHAAQSRSISPQSRQPLQPRERDSFWHLQLPPTSSRSSRLRTPKLVALSECSRVLEA